jgi:putative transposase
MSRYRLLPTPAQETVLRDYCGHARYVWNLAVEQHSWWHPGRKGAPHYLQQCRQLTQARAAHPWLAAGSQTVQQQALRDFAQAMAAFLDPANPARRPSWRKAGRDEGFRITGRRGRQWDLWRLSRNAAINIAAGHAVTARGGDGATRPVNREPQLLLQSV